MMDNTSRSQYKLKQGTVIRGKWNGNEYTVIRELGRGANGIVYLVSGAGGRAAMKISDNGASIISEMNILKSFSKVQGPALGPSLLEADDWTGSGTVVPFYIIEYIEGPGFLEFIKQKGPEWTGVLMLQLLNSLMALHKEGWVFGDLKPDNLIVTLPDCSVRCIDVGGTTMIGRSVKEFTEFFDRGYWGLGSRRAEPSYDLFAVAMIFLNASYPSRFPRKGEGYTQLTEAVKQKPELSMYRTILSHALTGKYSRADEMREDIIEVLSRPRQAASVKKRNKGPAAGKPAGGRSQRKRKKKGGIAETLLLAMLVSLLYAFYIWNHLL